MFGSLILIGILIILMFIAIYRCWKEGTYRGFLDGINWGDKLTEDRVSKTLQSMFENNDTIVCVVNSKNGIKRIYKITEKKHNG